MTVALPLELEGKTTEASSDNIVHINTPGVFWKGYQNNEIYITNANAAGLDKEILSGEASFPVSEDHTWVVAPDYAQGQLVKIDGVDYYVETRLYNSTLVPGEKTNYGIHNVYLDAHVDKDIDGNYYYINGGEKTRIYYDLSDVEIIVTAFAIQADGFKNVQEAYEAYMGQWSTNGKLTEDMIDADLDVAPEADAVRPAGYIPKTTGETISNLIINDNSDENTNLRALYNGEGGAANYLTGDLIIKDSKLDGTYAMNLYAVETEEVEMFVENTVLAGWVSYTGFDKVTFTNCTFQANSNKEIYNFIQPYDTTVFNNCKFDNTTIGMLKLADTDTVTFNNCTWNGQPVDAYLLDSDIIVEGGIGKVLVNPVQ